MRQSGCGAAGSALPWGGRGRKFKSCHSDQNRRFNRTSDFSLFYGLFRAFRCLNRLENVRYFFAQNCFTNRLDHMFDHIWHKKAISHKGFRHFRIFISCKMTAVLCSENRRFLHLASYESFFLFHDATSFTSISLGRP